MAIMPLPPGFRFHPTDAELMYYLKKKVMRKKFVFDAVTELNVYKFAPWDLPDKCLRKSKDLEWYFFCPKERKYASGARLNRATGNGYWRITGTDRLVTINQMTVGARKTLIFYKGQPPKGERTDWVMHEYKLGDKNLVDEVQDAYVICKIFQKGGIGPNNGAQYGALFNEEEWDEMFVESQRVAHQISSKNVPPGDINKIGSVSLSVPRDLSVNFPPEPDPSKCVPQNTAMQPSMKEICVGSSAVDPHILPDYVPPGIIGSSAAMCMTAPGNPFPWSTSNSVPSTAGPLVMDISPDMDVLSLLNMFTEDMNMPPVESNSNEFEINGHLQQLLDGTGILNDFGGLNDWIEELRDTEFGFSTEEAAYDPNPVLMGENAPFLELNDLSTPLTFPSEAGALDWLQSESIYAAHTYNTSIGMDELYSGVANPCPVEKVSGFNEYSAVLEEPHLFGNNLNELEKGNCIGNFEAHEFDAVRGCEVPLVITEPEGSNTAEKNQRRGEQQMILQLLLESVSFYIRAEHLIDSFHSGSSINFIAEVTLYVGECTKDALYTIWRSLALTFISSWGNQPTGDLESRMHNVAIHVLISHLGILLISVIPFFSNILCLSKWINGYVQFSWIIFIVSNT